MIIGIFPDASELSGSRLRGRIRGTGKSKIRTGIAVTLEPDEPSRRLLEAHAIRGTSILVDLEDTPPSGLPGEQGYIGGAFVKVYGTPLGKRSVRSFPTPLGLGEALEREDQELLAMPREGYLKAARDVIQLVEKDFGERLALDIRDISKAARIMARVGGAEDTKGHRLARLKFLWGSYLGECLLAEYGGRWEWLPPRGMYLEIPRGPLPPTEVAFFRVIEGVIRSKDPHLIDEWLERVSRAIASPVPHPVVE